MDVAVQVAIVGALSTVAGIVIKGLFDVWKNRKIHKHSTDKQVVTISNDLSFRSQVLSFKLEPWQWVKLHDAVATLFHEAAITRYFILKCFNGKEDPKNATGIHMVIDGAYVRYEYINYKLDDHYKSWIKRIRRGEEVFLVTDEMPRDAKLRVDYIREGVVSALLGFYGDETMPDGQTVATTYASYSSHTVVLTDVQRAACQRVTEMVSEWLNPLTSKRSMEEAHR